MKRILSLLVALLTFQFLMAEVAIITAKNAVGDVKYTGTNLSTAISNAGTNGTVVISEGTITLESCCDVSVSGVTIKGAGMGSTTITGNPSSFNVTQSVDYKALDYWESGILPKSKPHTRYKALLRINIACTLRDLTIDGGDCGTSKTGWYGTIYSDFDPVRANGTLEGVDIYMYNVSVKGNKTKTTMQVGMGDASSSNKYVAHVHAYGCHFGLNAGSTYYANVDVVKNGSSLSAYDTYFEGLTEGDVTTDMENCYYKYTIQHKYGTNQSAMSNKTTTFNTTIRQAINWYNDNSSLSAMAPALVAPDPVTGQSVLEQMTADLCDCEKTICDYDDETRWQLMLDFKTTLDASATLLNSYSGVNVTPLQTQIAAATSNKTAFFACSSTPEDLIINPDEVVDIPVGGQSCNNLIIKATQGESGQLTGDIANLDIQGDVYFDLCFKNSVAPFDNRIYYGFSVPFEVAVNNDGIRKLDPADGTTADALDDIRIRRYNGATRAANGANKTAWKIVNSGNLVPGVFYLIEFNSDCDTYRFLKNPSAQLNNMEDISLGQFAATNPLDAGWNGIGNNSLHYVGASTTGDDSYAYAQVLKYGANAFTLIALDEVTFVVGAPFFVQAGGSGEKVFFSNPDSNNPLLAPAANRIGRYTLRLLPLGADYEDFDDQMFITLSPDAEPSYTIGRDLTKMSMGTARKAQLWIDAYNTRLAAFDALAQTEQEIPVAFSAPRDETYLLSMTQDAGETLDLLYNGNLLCRLNDADYILDLPAGTSTGYSLRIGAAKVPTSVQTTATDARARKILRDGQMMIVCGSEVYTAQGMQVR